MIMGISISELGISICKLVVNSVVKIAQLFLKQSYGNKPQFKRLFTEPSRKITLGHSP